jgi:hypothetical protein
MDTLFLKYQKWADGRLILALVALILLANFLIIPAVYPSFQTLDTLRTYTPQQAYQLIDSYGQSGRQTYTVIELTLDIAYPVLTALMVSLIILYTFKRAFRGMYWLLYLSLAPFLILLADFLENLCIVVMLLSYPKQLLWLAQLSDLLTRTRFFLSPFNCSSWSAWSAGPSASSSTDSAAHPKWIDTASFQ